MKIIKFSYPYPEWPIERQTPNNSQIWGDFKFIVNDSNLQNTDFWVVFEDLLDEKESVKCPSNNTLFISAEGSATGTYDLAFLKQFSHIITSQKKIKLPNKHYFHMGIPWFVGKSYDELISTEYIKKTKNISIICSNKQLTEGHRKRFNFCMRLKDYFGENVDLFGRGIHEFNDKWEVLADYKYSIAIENSIEEHYFTEKLYDCFLAHTVPLYYGCPNVGDYFDMDSIIPIDLNDFDKTVKIIESLLNDESLYENKLDKIIEAKTEYLNKYNIYPMIVNFIEENNLLLSNQKYVNTTMVSRKKNNEIKLSLKERIKSFLKKTPILGKIWYYRNLGLTYETLQKYQNSDNQQLQRQRCRPWFQINGDKTLNLSCEGLDENAVVFDLGGYEGQWASDIYSKYNSHIFIFEPNEAFFRQVEKRFEKNIKIQVFNIGLSNKSYKTKLYLSDDGSSMFRDDKEEFVIITLRKAIDFFTENSIVNIDLMKINIEGGEYELLEHLIDSSFIKNIKNIKVQFHDFIIDNAEKRMLDIHSKLHKTHKIIYQYPFVWEHWQLR